MSSSENETDTSVERRDSVEKVVGAPSVASINEKGVIVDEQYADATIEFMREHDASVPEITPQEERRLRRKVMFTVQVLTFFINMVLYMDKATLSYASILDLWQHTGLTQDKYNNVNTIFYVGFLVGQIPGTWLVQKYPLSKVLFVLIFLWSVLTFLFCTAYNYPGVVMLRFFLGLTEAPTIPILTTTNGMFMTRSERAATMPVFYAACMASPIPIGFIAYGVIYAKSTIPPYKILYIIIGGLTLILSVVIWFLYPDNPASCKLMSVKERVWTIRRVQNTQQASIEQKTFNKKHAIEALKDPISWIFFFFFLLQQLANNLPYQQTILFEELGNVTNLGSTLVTVASAGFAVAWAAMTCIVLAIFPNTSFLAIIYGQLPAWVGSIAAATLDIHNSIGMLAVICMAANVFGVSWICAFGLASATAGSSYTKRQVRNGMVLVGYSVSNMISPQLWQSKDAPRYIPAWIVQIVLSFTVAPALTSVAWYVLARRNRERKQLLEQAIQEDADHGYVKNESGQIIEVNKGALDMTDLEDKTFIYPL